MARVLGVLLAVVLVAGGGIIMAHDQAAAASNDHAVLVDLLTCGSSPVEGFQGYTKNLQTSGILYHEFGQDGLPNPF